MTRKSRTKTEERRKACYEKKYQEADYELNRVYRLIREKLPEDHREEMVEQIDEQRYAQILDHRRAQLSLIENGRMCRDVFIVTSRQGTTA